MADSGREDNMIFRFEGNMRGGKTLSMTQWACFLSEATGQPVFANYTIQWPLFHRFELWRDLKDVRNAIICYDEISTSMDSRNYKSKDQIYFTHLFAQLGKLGNTMMYSAQRVHTVEKRIRDNTDFVIGCQRLFPSHTIVQSWFDTQKSAEIPIHIYDIILEDPTPFYRLYDSFEVVKTAMVID